MNGKTVVGSPERHLWPYGADEAAPAIATREEREARPLWTDWRQIWPWLVHRSFARILRYHIVGLCRHMLGRESAYGFSAGKLKQPLAAISREDPRQTDSGDAIPNIIFQTWKSRHDIPPAFRHWRRTFSEKNPEYQCLLWDDADNRRFIAEQFPWFLALFDNFPAAIHRADAIRPFFLFRYGGFYADMDTECLRPLSGMKLSSDVVLGAMGANIKFAESIPNAVMASKPFQLFWTLFITFMMEEAQAAKGTYRGPVTITGPAILHKTVLFYQSMSESEVRSRARPVIDSLPDEFRLRLQAGKLQLLPPQVWYPIDWTNGVHQDLLRRFLRRRHLILRPSDSRLLFPGSTLVTYWTHTW